MLLVITIYLQTTLPSIYPREEEKSIRTAATCYDTNDNLTMYTNTLKA